LLNGGASEVQSMAMTLLEQKLHQPKN